MNWNIKDILRELLLVFKSKYFYIGLIIFIFGIGMNIYSQVYLHTFESRGNNLPFLSDLILDNIPYFDLSVVYDWAVLITALLFIGYIIYFNKYREIPYYLLLLGIFYSLRGTFIILTPFGNPLNFAGSKSIFNGFSKYELGLYPSGHTGMNFLYLFLAKGKIRWVFGAFILVIIVSLLVSRAHYSIDILSGIIFAYTIYSIGEKYLYKFKIKN
jgi:membrane-associated phospholipid phosphatase